MHPLVLPSTTDDIIFDTLPPAALYRYARVCRASRDAVQAYIGRNFTIQKVLDRYFSTDEIDEFRRLQYDNGMIISGSTALQFFTRELYPESDLDIYVEHRYRGNIAFWLQDIGYQYVPSSKHRNGTLEQALVSPIPQPHDTPYWPAKIVVNFVKKEPQRKIQLITTQYSPLDVVLNFHSSDLRHEYYPHNKAYCLFPRATFDSRRRRNLVNAASKKTPEIKACLEKYSKRGWKILDVATRRDVERSNDTFEPELRYVGDGRCWTIPILPDMEFPAKNPVESNAWMMEFDRKLRPNLTFLPSASQNVFKFGFVHPRSAPLIHAIDDIIDKATHEREKGRYTSSQKYDDSCAALLKWYIDLHSA